MAFLPKYEFDIFISYAHADGREWVEAFHEELTAALYSRLPGRDRPALFLDKHDLRAGDAVDSKIAAGIENSALFLAIVSPKYLASPPCMRHEIPTFQDRYGPASNRIFQVVRFPIEGNPPVPQLLWVNCDEKGSLAGAIDGLLPGLVERLTQLRREMTQLYIAWPVNDVKEDRKRIELEFRTQGYVIRPDRAFNKHAGDDSIREELANSDISIHIFSAGNDPLAERQFRTACELGKPALIVTRNPEEPRRHPLDSSPAIYLGDPNAMRHLIERVKLNPGSRFVPPAGSARPVFLLFKPDLDWRCAADLTRMLRTHGAEVFPQSDPYPNPYSDIKLHRDDLRRCAGVILCGEDASERWLNKVDKDLTLLGKSDEAVGRLARAEYVVGSPPKASKQRRSEFIIRTKQDLEPFLKAAGVQ